MVGGIRGALSTVGGGPFLTNLFYGAWEGAVTGGIDAVLWGNNIGKEMLYGAAIGGAFAIATSDNMQNLIKGGGFRSNDNVLQGFVANKRYQDALTYFNMKATFDEASFANGQYRGFFSLTDKQIHLSELAFKEYFGEKASFDLLNSVYQKELWHQSRFLSGKMFIDVGDNWPTPSLNYMKAEDALGHVYIQKNIGAFPSVNSSEILKNSYKKGFQNFISKASLSARTYFFHSSSSVIYKNNFTNWMHSVPRRFKFLLPYTP